MPSIQYVHICEYARMDPNGTVSIIGIFDTIHVTELPATFPILHIITSLGGQRGEHFQFLTRIAAPDGQVIQAAPPVDIAIHQEEARATQINGYVGTAFPSLGTYSIEIVINGMVVHTLPFKVVHRAA
jgi:hypothetical protein